MAKAALLLASILLLAFSAGPTGTRPNQMLFQQSDIAGLSKSGAQNAADGNGIALLTPLARTNSPPPVYSAEDRLVPALLIYLALILIGSAIAIGLVWHTYKRQLQ